MPSSPGSLVHPVGQLESIMSAICFLPATRIFAMARTLSAGWTSRRHREGVPPEAVP